jgi:DNA-binding NarL/FixJ family response regulator
MGDNGEAGGFRDVLVRVLIVADDPLARAGLAAVLANQPECAVAGQVAGSEDLIDVAAVYQPDVVLWDLGWEPMPESAPFGEGELEPFADLEELGFPVLALLPDDAQASAAWAADAWSAGAVGLLPRDAGVDALVAALLAVDRGLVVIDPALTEALFVERGEPPELPVEDLTPRELEVLQLLAEGLPNKTIAFQLAISEHTVKFHVNAILGKLGAQSRTEAVVRATRLGLIIL